MIKDIFKGLLKLTIFVFLVLIMALFLSKVLRPDRLDEDNNTKDKVLGFYNLKKNSMDVIFLGSSHIYYGVNPAIINEKTDLNSYIFSGECQPIEVSYYFLKEAIKYQSPKLVVLDVFGLSDSINFCKTEGIYRVNLENLKTSEVKIEAFNNLFNKEDILYNIFDVSLYHNRWYELYGKDILKKEVKHNFGYTLGKNYSLNIVNFDNLYNGEIKEVNLDYLNKIKKLCDENNIELLLIKTPFYLSEDDAKIFTFIQKNTKYNFIDFNLIKNDIGYVFDIDGDIWHANMYGATKISEYLSTYINENYNIDKSNDVYDEEYHKMIIDMKKEKFKRIWDVDTLLEQIKKDDHILFMNYNFFEGSLLSAQDKHKLNNIGYDFYNHPKEKAIIKVEEGKVEAYYSYDYFSKDFYLGDNVFKVESNGYMWKNGVGLNIANNYACVSVVDKKTYEVLDSFCMDTEGSLYIHRDQLEDK